MGFGNRFEFSVMILAPSADLFDAVLPALEVYHLMQHGIQSFFDWVIQHLGGNVQFIRASVLALPDFGGGTVSVSPRLALHGDNRHGQQSVKKVCVEGVINVFQLSDCSAHFRGFFHIGDVPPIL